MSESFAPSLFVVASDALVRSALIARAAPRFEVLGDAEPGEWSQAAAADLVLWDFSAEHAEHVGHAADAGASVMALTDDARDASAALRQGARAALGRNVTAERMHAAAVAVVEGLVVLSPEHVSSGAAQVEVDVRLTERELEVVELLAEGLSNREIARRLHISEHTAKFHVQSVLDKLDATTRTEAVVRAARAGLLAL